MVLNKFDLFLSFDAINQKMDHTFRFDYYPNEAEIPNPKNYVAVSSFKGLSRKPNFHCCVNYYFHDHHDILDGSCNVRRVPRDLDLDLEIDFHKID